MEILLLFMIFVWYINRQDIGRLINQIKSTDKTKETPIEKFDILLSEYNELRGELKQRIAQRDSFAIQFIVSSLTIITLAIGYNHNVLYLLPILSIFYSLQIFSSYQVHTRLVEFIRENIEKRIAEEFNEDAKSLLWESYCDFERQMTISGKIGGRKKFFQIVLVTAPVLAFVLNDSFERYSILYYSLMEIVSIWVLVRDVRIISYNGLNKLAFCDWQIKDERTDEPQKAIFFDKDGTLHVDKVMTRRIKDLELLPGAVDLVKTAKEKGYRVIIVTNQSAIAKDYYSKERMHLFIWALRKKLKGVDAVYYCPHLSETGCNCKKPKTGMFLRAQKEFNIDFSQSIMVGDRMSDIKAGVNAGIGRNIFVTTGIYTNGDYHTEPEFDTIPHETVSSLEEISLEE